MYHGNQPYSENNLHIRMHTNSITMSVHKVNQYEVMIAIMLMDNPS